VCHASCVSQRAEGNKERPSDQITFFVKPGLATHVRYNKFTLLGGVLLTLISHELVFIIPHRGPMVKKVVLPDDSVGEGKDGIVGDDDLSLENYSDGEESGGRTEGSEDVSIYEGNPKEAPRYAFFGANRCRAKFKLKEDRQVTRVCGGPMDCSRKHHKKSPDRGLPGIYDTIRTRIYVDGILSTYRSTSEQEDRDAKDKKLMDEATEELTGSRAYQMQLQATLAELGEPGGTPNSLTGTPDSGVQVEGWDFDSDEEEATAGARRSTRHLGKDRASLKPVEDRGTPKPTRKEHRKKASPSDPGADNMSHRLAVEVRNAITTMTASMASMVSLLEDNGKRKGHPRMDDDSDGSAASSDEEEVPKSRSQKGRN